jgi:hypothetical protein
LASLLIPAATALAFALYPANGFLGYTYNKWGDPAIPTGATVYWSLMPVGTEGSDYCAPACTNGEGTSSLTLPNFYDTVTDTFSSVDLTDPVIFGYIRKALRTWGAAAGVTFIHVANDTGVPINDAAAEPPNTGQIRIGVFDTGDTGPAAVGYAPPPNGFIPNSSQLATGAGDILLNSRYAYQNPAGAEGTPLDAFPLGGGPFLNDFEGLILHEIGHALGVDHSDVSDAVMCGWPNSCIYDDVDTYAINRELATDDISAIQTLYGLPVDTDNDSVPDAVDNCTTVANANQRDTNTDGYGNLCDADLNDTGGVVNAGDLAIFRSVFGSSNADADLNGSGTVNAADLALFRSLFGQPPGPSAFEE